MEAFVDLDELVLRCADVQAREYISDAVACYRAGVPRQAIVAAWTAIVYDFLHKLRLLSMTGNADATTFLNEYESIRADTNESERKRRLLKFENEVLVSAFKLELISDVDSVELERLRLDRHLCAHPSMRSIDEPFKPTPELARYHLRNAVVLFLEKPPAQGRAAAASIFRLVDEAGFSPDPAVAEEFFRKGHLLNKARGSLVKTLLANWVDALVKHGQTPEVEMRYWSAISAVISMYREWGEAELSTRLSRLSGEIPTDDLHRVIAFIRHVPLSWQLLDEAGRIRLGGYLETVKFESAGMAFQDGLHIPGIERLAHERVSNLTVTELVLLISKSSEKQLFIEAAIRKFDEAASFYQATDLGKGAIIPLANKMSDDQAKRVVRAFATNHSIYAAAHFVPSIMTSFFSLTRNMSTEMEDEWRLAYTTVSKPSYKDNHSELRSILLQRYPALNELDTDSLEVEDEDN